MTKDSDAIFEEHENEIRTVAKYMHQVYPVENVQLYRGILLEDENIQHSKLIPMEHIQSLSFSTCIEAARVFADVNHDMGREVMRVRPDSKGYMIEYTPIKPTEEILYHHSWADKLRIDVVAGNWLDPELLLEQKEVILHQWGVNFLVKPIS